MENPLYDEKSRELPGTDLIFGITPFLLFILIYLEKDLFDLWPILDAIPLALRISFFVFFCGMGLLLIIKSHTVLFDKNHKASSELIQTGILNKTRNPMYLGINLIFLGVSLSVFSIFGLILWGLMTLVIFPKMVQFEENIMEKMFGDAFLKYKATVPRWIPHIFPSKDH